MKMCECCGEDDPKLLVRGTKKVWCYSCWVGSEKGRHSCPAADAHLHLKFVRNIHPNQVGQKMIQTSAEGGKVAFRIPYTLTRPDGEPVRIHPLVLNVQHNPPNPNPRVLADEPLILGREITPDTQPTQFVGFKDVPGVSSNRDLPGPGETRVEKIGRKT